MIIMKIKKNLIIFYKNYRISHVKLKHQIKVKYREKTSLTMYISFIYLILV